MRSIVLAGLLLAAALAGCVGGDDPATDDQTPVSTDPSPGNATTLEAPTWALGDWWTWETGAVGEVTYAVTGQEGGDWIVDTTNEQVAFFDARFDVSTLGKVRASDLAGSQNDTRVTFFDWPLTEGKTWTTTWDSVERSIEVTDVSDGRAELVARQDGRVAVEYTYDASVRGFRTLTFLDADGTESFAMELADHGRNFTGTTVRWDLTKVVDRSGTFGAQPVSWGDSFEAPEGTTDLWLSLDIECPSGFYTFGFGGNGSGYGANDRCPAEHHVAEPVVEEPNPGRWDYGFTGTSPTGEGTYDALLYIRALEQIPVDEG